MRQLTKLHIKKRKRKASSSARVNKGKGSTSTTSTSTTNTRSAIGSNDPVPIQMVYPTHHFHEDIGSYEDSAQVQTDQVHTMLQQPSSMKKSAIKKKLTPKKLPVQTATPASPASNTRSKKKLQLE